MSDLREIADRKIASEREKLVAALPLAITAVKSAQNLNGTLHSGNTANQMKECCAEALTALGAEITKEYLWAASTAVFLSQSFARSLTDGAPQSIEPLYSFGVAQLTHQLQALGMADLIPALTLSIDQRRDTVLADIRIELDRKFAERRRSVLRNLTMGIGNIMTKAMGK